MKKSVKWALTRNILATHCLSRLCEQVPRVLVYHRFAAPGATVPHRVSGDRFAWQLDQIRGNFDVITLSQCVAHFQKHGNWPKGTVVLTIDDGYRDMYQWAYPELLKRNLPATFFVTTRFIDGELLLWPDRLDYAIRHTTRESISIAVGGAENRFSLLGEKEKFIAWKSFSDHCIRVPNAERVAFIEKVERLLESVSPAAPPAEYAPSTWDELREMHRHGIEIGAHTNSHPILSKIDPALLDEEISASKRIIEQRLGSVVETFCYPNSGPGDINDDVISAVINAGFKGAVFGMDLHRWDPYTIPRMGASNDKVDFLWKVYGGERVRKGM